MRRASRSATRRCGSGGGGSAAVVTDRLRSCGAALKIGVAGRQVTDRWEDNRAETSRQPLRRRERAMLRFRRLHSLQTFAAIRSSVPHVNAGRSLASRPHHKATRAAAFAKWRALCAG